MAMLSMGRWKAVQREILRQYLPRRLLETKDDDNNDDDNNHNGWQGEEEGEARKEGEDNECKGLFFSSNVTDNDFFHRPGKG